MNTHSIEVLFEFLEAPNPEYPCEDFAVWLEDLLYRAIGTTNFIINNHRPQDVLVFLSEVNARLDQIKEKISGIEIFSYLDLRMAIITQYEEKFEAEFKKASGRNDYTLFQLIVLFDKLGLMQQLREITNTDVQRTLILSKIFSKSSQNVRALLGKTHSIRRSNATSKQQMDIDKVIEDMEEIGLYLDPE